MTDLVRSTKAFMDIWRIVGAESDTVALEVKYLLFGLQHNVICTKSSDVSPLVDRPTIWIVCDSLDSFYNVPLRWIPEADRVLFSNLHLNQWDVVNEQTFRTARTRLSMDYQYQPGPPGDQGPPGPPGPLGMLGPMGIRGEPGVASEHKYIDKASIEQWVRSSGEFPYIP